MEILNFKIFKKKAVDTVFFNRTKLLKVFFPEGSKPLIFDVGANVGQTVEQMKEIYPQSEIHCFEPAAVPFNILSQITQKYSHVHCHQLALSNRQEDLSLHTYAESAHNSFLPINPQSDSLQRGVHPRVSETLKEGVRLETCHTTTLDAFCKEKGIPKIDVLKIDVQGYEKEVLEGARNTLQMGGIKLVVVEIIFDDVYGKGYSFSDIESLLIPYGYRLWDIAHIYKDLSQQRTCWVDCVYVHVKN